MLPVYLFAFLSVQCCVVYCLVNCTYIKMNNFDLSETQYDMRSELGVFDCKYVEANEITGPANEIQDLRKIQQNV